MGKLGYINWQNQVAMEEIVKEQESSRAMLQMLQETVKELRSELKEQGSKVESLQMTVKELNSKLELVQLMDKTMKDQEARLKKLEALFSPDKPESDVDSHIRATSGDELVRLVLPILRNPQECVPESQHEEPADPPLTNSQQDIAPADAVDADAGLAIAEGTPGTMLTLGSFNSSLNENIGCRLSHVLSPLEDIKNDGETQEEWVEANILDADEAVSVPTPQSSNPKAAASGIDKVGRHRSEEKKIVRWHLTTRLSSGEED